MTVTFVLVPSNFCLTANNISNVIKITSIDITSILNVISTRIVSYRNQIGGVLIQPAASQPRPVVPGIYSHSLMQNGPCVCKSTTFAALAHPKQHISC